MSAVPSELHRGDRRCDRCGYLLRGLTLGSRCPECGAATTARRTAKLDGPLSTAPQPVIRAMRRRTLVLLVGLPGLLAAQFAWNVHLSPAGLSAVLLGAAGAWLAAAAYVTRPVADPQAEWHGFARADRLRREAFRFQVIWILIAGCGAAVHAQLVPGFGTWILVIGTFVAIGAIFVMVELWAKVATWARDDTAARLLAFVPWCALAGLAYRPLFVLAAVIAAVALLSMLRSQTWSLIHHGEESQRSMRREEREKAHWRKVVGRLRSRESARRRP